MPNVSAALQAFHAWTARRSFRKNRAQFYEGLALAYDDGQSILDYLSKSIPREREHGSPSVADALQTIKDLYGQHSDRPFSQALLRFIPESERMILMAAERSGSLPAALRFVGATATQISRMRAGLKQAVASPLITVAITGYTMWMFATDLIPILDQVIPPDQWSRTLLLLRRFSDALIVGGKPMLAICAVGAVLAYYQMPRWTGAKRRVFDDVPIAAMYRDYHGAMFLMSYASLLRAGVGQIEALQMIAANATPWVRWHCNTIANRLTQNPTEPGLAFNTGVLPRKVVNRLIDLAERSQFYDAIGKIGFSIIEQTDAAFKELSENIGIGIEILAGALLMLLTVGFSMVTTQLQSSL